MITVLRLIFIVFLFSNNNVQAKINELFQDIVKFLDEAFERRVGGIYNNRYIDTDLNDDELNEFLKIEDDATNKNEKEFVEDDAKEVVEEKPKEQKESKFEDKYLDKFKAFKNEYYFTEDEKLSEEQKYTELLNIFNKESMKMTRKIMIYKS